jgi:CRISPR/Cas system endoribonuclease Cas6 (RAMP superfamily)
LLLSHQGGESSELEALGIQREDRRRRSLLFGFGAPAFFKAAITVTLSPENKLRISRGKIVTRYIHPWMRLSVGSRL